MTTAPTTRLLRTPDRQSRSRSLATPRSRRTGCHASTASEASSVFVLGASTWASKGAEGISVQERPPPYFHLYKVVSLHMCVLPYKYRKILEMLLKWASKGAEGWRQIKVALLHILLYIIIYRTAFTPKTGIYNNMAGHTCAPLRIRVLLVNLVVREDLEPDVQDTVPGQEYFREGLERFKAVVGERSEFVARQGEDAEVAHALEDLFVDLLDEVVVDVQDLHVRRVVEHVVVQAREPVVEGVDDVDSRHVLEHGGCQVGDEVALQLDASQRFPGGLEHVALRTR